MTPNRLIARKACRLLVCATVAAACGAASAVDLADQPPFASISVPGNVALALSVEWPTATTPSYPSTTAYSAASTYIGYFDPSKCYLYVHDSVNEAASYFKPHSFATNHACASSASTPLWSGNYMNWASMQTLDVFRWTLTGGYRSTDVVGNTILTKTYADTEGSGNKAPDKTLTAGVSGATPFNWAEATTSIKRRGTTLLISGTNTRVAPNTNNPTYGCIKGSTCLASNTAVAYSGHSSHQASDSSLYADPAQVYRLYINVQVCNASVGVESNCVAYGKDYKPEGLIQGYSSKLRFAAFGYLNDSTVTRDGGVLRAPMKSVGPTAAVPGSAAVTNGASEWDPATGIMLANPDSALAAETSTTSGVTITQSGVMNYLNKFGQVSSGGSRYKNFDPVSELYYSTLRYFRNVGPVAAYNDLSSGSGEQRKQWLDGFPVSTTWNDPVAYSCQKNFVLGIGDVNTHRDGNLPGSSLWTSGQEPSTPSEVTSDNVANGIDVTKSTKMVAQLEEGRYNTFYIAGLAYDAHTVDIRKDLDGDQLVNTYWLDVMEDQVFVASNQYWLAAKYGGFRVPEAFSPYASSNGKNTLSLSDWYTSTDTLTASNGKAYQRPDNYFAAHQGSAMVSGLNAAFSKIAAEAGATATTAFSPITRKTSSAGMANYSSSYDPKNWTGKVVASTLVSSGSGAATMTDVWDAQAILQKTSPNDRKIVTCCTAAGAGLQFQAAALSAATLDPRTYYASFAQVPGLESESQSAANFVAYLRGDIKQELANGGAYRNRSAILGDIVDSKPSVVGPPSFPYGDQYNPGYSGFKSARASRDTIVYVGANDGMMHAFDGALTGSTQGTERFAYIPSFTYGESSSTSERYFATNGLAALGNPNYSHRYYVNATPKAFDANLGAAGGAAPGKSDWRTLLIGGLGKGGKGYYAIDVTDPSTWTSEAAVAGKVMWEFTDDRMGYSYGDAHVVKTAKYGWVAILPSGYNNSDGKGYIFIVDPASGKLLQAIETPEGSTSAPINLGHIRAFINDYEDYTADAVYAADLRGNLWRFDLTAETGYGQPQKIAILTNASGDLLPATTAPLLGVDPTTRKRYVMVGTGQMLSPSDINSTTPQAFYAIADGTGDVGGFYTDKTLPEGYGHPLTRDDVTPVDNFKSELGDAASPMGWVYDFSTGSSGIAERMTVDGDVAIGMVAFSVSLPNGDACAPAGSSRTFAVRFATAKSALVNSDNSMVEFISDSSTTTELLFTKDPEGSTSLTRGGSASSSTGAVTSSFVDPGLSGYRFLSWREISTVD
jgi:type IV pilus assembly protein PilY1